MDDARQTDPGGPDTPQLMALVYDELRALASEYMRRERPGHTLQPTALVNEAFLRLARLDRMKWKDIAHFQAAAAGVIRRVLVDHARARNAAKRGGGRGRVTLSGLEGVPGASAMDLLALDEALARLAKLDARKARIVELRFFGGLTIEQTARSLGVGTTAVEDDWAFARPWLRRELRQDDASRPSSPPGPSRPSNGSFTRRGDSTPATASSSCNGRAATTPHCGAK